MDKWDKCNFPVDIGELYGRECYGGLDLSSNTDITAFVLVFPPRDADEKYIVRKSIALFHNGKNARNR